MLRYRLAYIVCALVLTLIPLRPALSQSYNFVGWGNDTQGQLGDGTSGNGHGYSTPVFAQTSATVSAIATADSHTLALKPDGTLLAWGYNDRGQLGDGTTTPHLVPETVPAPSGIGPLSNVIAIAAGYRHSVALRSDGTVWTWGDNTYGQLGTGTTVYRVVPTRVVGLNGAGFLTGVVAIAAGYGHTVALKGDGTVWAWGRNDTGQVGNGTRTQQNTPVQVKGQDGTGYLTNVTAIAAGWYHTLALKPDGTAWGWGYSEDGELGVGNYKQVNSTPLPVRNPNYTDTLTGIAGITAGQYHSMFLMQNGMVLASGYNFFYGLGIGTQHGSSVPIQVVGPGGAGYLTDVKTIAAGRNFTLALKQDGTLWVWGDYIGLDGSSPLGTPVRATTGIDGTGSLTGVQGIAAGGYQEFALLSLPSGVYGTMQLQGCTNLRQSITFAYRPTDGSAPFTRTRTLSANGTFAFSDIPGGKYDVAIKGAIWLQNVVPVDTTGGNVSVVVTQLRAGDANNDNVCDIADFGILANAYNSDANIPGSGYDVRADFDCNGVVDIADFGLLVNNYNTTGDM